MKRFFSLLVYSFLLFLFTFCGKKGPLLAPLIKNPQKIENFEVQQRGDRIILNWTNPTSYSDGSPLSEIKEIEIWLIEEEQESEETEEESSPGKRRTFPKISLDEFKKRARLEDVIKKDEFPEHQRKKDKDSHEFEYFYKLTEENFTSKLLTFAVIIKDKKEKSSEFSNLLTIGSRIVPLPPQEVQFSLYDDRIEIQWKEPAKNIDNSSPAKINGYNIYRREEGKLPRRLNSSLIKEKKYSDKNFLFGQVYHYFVRATSIESSPFWESNDSNTIEVLAKDTFAPAAPIGLVSIAGENFISLSWDVNQEKDLLGYSVWRKEEGQEEYTLLTPQPLEENIYNDSTVEINKRYYYAITAQDKNGNESEKSKPISEKVRKNGDENFSV